MAKKKEEKIGEFYNDELYNEIIKNGFGESLMPVEYEDFQPGLVCKVISITCDDKRENFVEKEVRCRIEKVGRVSKRSTRDGRTIKVQKLRFTKQG